MDEALVPAMAWRSLRLLCRRAIDRNVDLQVEGLEHLPVEGPVVIAARHFHHLYDGCAIGLTVPRHVHVLVAMDWLTRPAGRAVMARACGAARFPVVLRPAATIHRPELRDDPVRRDAYADTAARQLRRAVRESVELLRDGHVLLVFPEGYPNVDPGFTPKTDDATFLPFEAGFIRLVALAQRDGTTRVPIVPTGLAYTRGSRWGLTLRFDPPRWLEAGTDHNLLLAAVEARVRALSTAQPATS
jgi:1-acyl-sn-glycerol-3-phosphate acyltransferase